MTLSPLAALRLVLVLGGDLAALELHLALDQLAQRGVVVILEVIGIELVGLLLDQRRRDLEQVVVGGLGAEMSEKKLSRLLDLVLVVQRLEQQALAARA